MSNLYIPPNAINMKDVKTPRLMIGIVGASATGKTTSALTFPNPIVLDMDGGLTAHTGKDIISIPFYEDNFCKSILKAQSVQGVVNKRDCIKKWLTEEANKLTRDQTLILDSWSALQSAFDRVTELQPAMTKFGQVDEFAFWARKIEYSRDIMDILQGLTCNVIVLFHEQKTRDEKTGELLDKIAPLMQGKFVSQLSRYFSDFFRALVIPKIDSKGKPTSIPGFNTDKEANFAWQVKANAFFDAKTRMTIETSFVPQHFSSLNYV